MKPKTARTLIIATALTIVTVIFLIFGLPKILDNQYLRISLDDTEASVVIETPTAEAINTNTAGTQTEGLEIAISNYLSGNLPDRKPMIIDGTKYTIPLQDGPYCVPHSPTGTEATHTFQVIMPEDWILIIDSVTTVIDGETYSSQLLVQEKPFTGEITVTNGALCGGPIEWQQPLEQHRLEVLSLFVKNPQVSYR